MRLPRRGNRLVLILAIVLAGVPAWPAGAQLSEEDANRAAASTVMLSARIWEERDGVTKRFKDCLLGSGSVVSADGRLILTNSHVVGKFDIARSLAAADGEEIEELIIVSTVEHRRDVPVQQYVARIVEDDLTLDLAVLRIMGDAPSGFEHELPINLSPLELGNPASANRVTLFGYPETAELEVADNDEEVSDTGATPTDTAGCAPIPAGTIRSYEGAVSGFSGSMLDAFEVDVTASFGNSGGTAVDDGGQLIGVPTSVRSMAGGGIVEVIPIERAREFLARLYPEEFGPAASLTPGAAMSPIPPPPASGPALSPSATQPSPEAPTVTPVPPTDTPTPPTPEPVPPSPPSGAAESPGVASFPVYEVGETVVTANVANLRAGATTTSPIVETVPADSSLEISGIAVTLADSELAWWPVMNRATDQSGFVREDLLVRPEVGVPAARGNPARTGEMPGPGPAGKPIIQWRATIATDGRLMADGSLVVGGGSVYFTTIDSADGGALTVHAMDASTGEERWQVQPMTSAGLGSPAVSGELVYVAGEDGVYALDAMTGEERWQTETSGGGGSPVVVGGVVYVDSFFGVHALDAATGEERWRAAISDIPDIPAVAGGLVYINSSGVSSAGDSRGSVHAFDSETGGERWRAAYDDWVASIAVAGGMVYAGGRDGFVYALDAATGEERWRSDRIGDWFVAKLAVAGGVVFVTGKLTDIEADSVYALDAATGEELWSEPGGRRRVGALVVAEGVVYIGDSTYDWDSTDSHVYALDAATGVEQWRLAIGPGTSVSSLAVVNGIVYVGSENGYIFAIGGTD